MDASNAVIADITRTLEEFKAGHLKDYAPAKSLNDSDSEIKNSWGPAMRK